uniref:Uncharacterized protein n=1 Tax=Arundo donax TaxID=35708 RepID=A0A0A9HBE1_ARUDO
MDCLDIFYLQIASFLISDKY